MNGCVRMQLADGLSQKGSFPEVSFDEMGFAIGQQGEDEAWKSCSAAKVGEASCRAREESGKLGAIEDVSLPEAVEVTTRD